MYSGNRVVKLVVKGSRHLLPPGSWQIHAGDVSVVIGEPIDVAGRSRDQLMERVHRFMSAQLGEHDGRPAVADAMAKEAM